MPRITFSDFDEFAEAINGISGRFIPTARSQGDWWVDVKPAGRIAVQQVQIGGPSAFVGDGSPDAITVGIPLATREPVRLDGESIDDGSFILGRGGRPFTFAAARATRWAGIHVPMDHESMTAELRHSLHANTSPATHNQAALAEITSARLFISRLFATDGSVDFSEAAAARAMEEEVMAVTSHVIEKSSVPQHTSVGRPRFSRDSIVARALGLIEENEGQPLLLCDLCRAAQVSERTLRNVFQEYFGVGPMRMLKVSRLSEIRSALIAAGPRETTIAKIVTRYGVWDFSSFARNYKALYGETASETLHSPAARKNNDAANANWIRFASRKFVDPFHDPSF